MPASAAASCLPHAAADARCSGVKSTPEPPTVSRHSARNTCFVLIFGRSASARASAASFSAASRPALASSSSSGAGSAASASSPASLASASASFFASSAAAFSASSAAYLASASSTASTSASTMPPSCTLELYTTGTARYAPSFGILCSVTRSSCSTCGTCTTGYSGGGTSFFLPSPSSSSSPPSSSASGAGGSFHASNVTPLASVLPTSHEWSSVACTYLAVSPPPSSSSPPPAPATRSATYTPAAPVHRCSAPSSVLIAPLVSLPPSNTFVSCSTRRWSASSRSRCGLAALAAAAAAASASLRSDSICASRAASAALRSAAST
mmetsp:Transcript_17615/g.61993  ORF Transcript_17615/g.61993 Transcript_17615/m.61993 type:complete len:325 (-) Transcript_17615:324-1298(-)